MEVSGLAVCDHRFTTLACAAMVSLVLSAGCSEDKVVPLAEFAGQIAEKEEFLEKEPRPPVIRLTSVEPGRYLSWLRRALAVVDNDRARKLVETLDAVPFANAAYAEVENLELSVDERNGDPVVSSLTAWFTVQPGGGDRPEALLGRWTAFLESAARAHHELVLCRAVDELLVCRVAARGNLGDVNWTAVADRARKAFKGKGPHLDLILNIGSAVEVLERAVTTLVFWALAPEELEHLESVRIWMSDSPDRLELNIAGKNSGMLEALSGLFVPSHLPLELPADLPVVAWTSVGSVRQRLEKVENYWDGKLPVVSSFKLSKLLDHSWETQLLDLAGGVVGVLQFDKMDVTRPLAAVVVMFQPRDKQEFTQRMSYIFPKKYFRLVSSTLEGGEVLTKALRQLGSKGTGTERLAWMETGDTFFFGSSEVLEKFAGRMHGAHAARNIRSVALRPGEGGRAMVLLPALLGSLSVPEEAGVTAMVILRMIKASLHELEGEILAGVDVIPGKGLTIRIDNLLHTLEVLVEKAEPLMRLVELRS